MNSNPYQEFALHARQQILKFEREAPPIDRTRESGICESWEDRQHRFSVVRSRRKAPLEVTKENLPALPYSFDPIRDDVVFVLAVAGVHKLVVRRWARFSFIKNHTSSTSPRVQDFITRKCGSIRAEILKGKLKSVHTLSILVRQKDGSYSIRNIKP